MRSSLRKSGPNPEHWCASQYTSASSDDSTASGLKSCSLGPGLWGPSCCDGKAVNVGSESPSVKKPHSDERGSLKTLITSCRSWRSAAAPRHSGARSGGYTPTYAYADYARRQQQAYAHRQNGSSSSSAHARSGQWRSGHTSSHNYPYDDDSEASDTDGYTYSYQNGRW